MIANYFLSMSIGKKRKDGSPFYVMNVLAIDRFGLLNAVPVFFPDLDSYQRVFDMRIPSGTAIIPTMTLSGQCVDVRPDERYVPLMLDAPASKR